MVLTCAAAYVVTLRVAAIITRPVNCDEISKAFEVLPRGVSSVPKVAKPVMIAKPSARPIRSTNLAVGSLMTPPMILERIDVVLVNGSKEKVEVT